MVDCNRGGRTRTSFEFFAVVGRGEVAPTYTRDLSTPKDERTSFVTMLTENAVHMGRLRIGSHDGIELLDCEGIDVVLSSGTRSAQAQNTA